jgi:antirestriction protein
MTSAHDPTGSRPTGTGVRAVTDWKATADDRPPPTVTEGHMERDPATAEHAGIDQDHVEQATSDAVAFESTPVLEAHESESRDQPWIYVASLTDYVSGQLHGTWIDASQDLEEVQTAITNMLTSSPSGPGAEEFAIHDHDGFGHYHPGEYQPIDSVVRIAHGIIEHGRAFAAWAAHAGDDPETLQRFEDVFLGNYDSVASYAHDLLDNLPVERIIEEHVPESLQAYIRIDSEALGRDLMLGGDITIVEHHDGVWVFEGNS